MGMMSTEGAKFEFFLSASFDGSPEAQPAQNYIYLVELVQDDGTGTFNTLAAASYEAKDMDTVRKNFSIFYKGEVGTGVTGDFKVRLTTTNNIGTMPILLNSGDVQWGFKVFREEYPLTTMSLPTC